MLVLGRHIGEVVRIGENIRVFVVAIGHGKVRLGFIAPSDVVIVREELLDPANRPPLTAPE